MTPRGVLAFEASCDDTAVAWLDGNGIVIANCMVSNYHLSTDTGGIVPERQARAHLENFTRHLSDLAATCPDLWSQIDLVAATLGPGLVGGLMLGATFARGIAWRFGLPFQPVNHLAGHILSPRLQSRSPAFPYLALLVSGGHTQIVYVRNANDFILLATTLDDALGEAFDKTAALLDLGFPGGPVVEECAKTGDPGRFPLPRPLRGRTNPNFSFSGLKSAVRRLCHPDIMKPRQIQDSQWRADLAASFQEACMDCICDRLDFAMRNISARGLPHPQALAVVGGVARNLQLRHRVEHFAARINLPVAFPAPWLCTDNAVMIGWAALEQLEQFEQVEHYGDLTLGNRAESWSQPVRAQWPLDQHRNTV